MRRGHSHSQTKHVSPCWPQRSYELANVLAAAVLGQAAVSIHYFTQEDPRGPGFMAWYRVECIVWEQ